jgi:hypothetical protein
MNTRVIRRRTFSLEEIEYIKLNWYNKKLTEIGIYINRHPIVVEKNGKKLGLPSKLELKRQRRNKIWEYIKLKYGIAKNFTKYPRNIIKKISSKFSIDRRVIERDMEILGFQWTNKYKKSRDIDNYVLKNWGKMRIQNIAKNIDVSRHTIMDHAKKLSLPKKDRKGANSGMWKGGCCHANKRKMSAIRKSVKGYRWDNGVKIRDGMKCKKCNKAGHRNKYYRIVGVTAHHIYNFYDYPLKRFDIKNGITLCIKCHEKFHHKYGYRYTNKCQLMRFLKNG